MKATLITFTALTVPLLASAGEAKKEVKRPTAKEIIAKHIEAIGGIEAQKKHATRKMEGSITLAQVGAPWKMTITQKAPDMRHVRVEVADGVFSEEGVAGKVAWNKAPGVAARQLEGEELGEKLRDARFFGHLEMLEQGEFTYAGIEAVDGRLCHLLKVSFEGDDILWGDADLKLFIDPKTYQLAQIAIPMGSIDPDLILEIKMDDYKKVDGLPIAHAMTMTAAGEAFATLKFDKVTHGVEVDDSFFAMPKE